MRNEWGLVERRKQGLGDTTTATVTPPSTTTYAAVGAGLGAVAGALGAAAFVSKGAALMGGVVGAGVGGIGGYVYASKQQPTVTVTTNPSNPGTPAKTLDIVFAPGTMTPIGLSLTGDNAVSFTLPGGVTTGVVNLLSADSTIVKTSGITMNPPATATAVAVGTTTLNAAWTDASGNPQQSQIAVTVSA